ncbi:uncharacterized protein KY384_006873 [Bacidia gigantensis]|uniref:uncharacterized protein n=1 Tax=Bacidia gigantensis TaxID=2732470 RepID=UPI001D037CC6|nr:uncharacterized protein KY384_006873 [Bacidia gigantensis]KAG8527957.1 hypothetical protein KY384_006873 [Bacidia gigantensis]
MTLESDQMKKLHHHILCLDHSSTKPINLFFDDPKLTTEQEASLNAILRKMTPDQQEVLQYMIGSQNLVTMVQGPPGTGKSTLMAYFMAMCHVMEYPTLFTASSNAAVNVLIDKLQDFDDECKEEQHLMVNGTRFYSQHLEIAMIMRNYQELHGTLKPPPTLAEDSNNPMVQHASSSLTVRNTLADDVAINRPKLESYGLWRKALQMAGVMDNDGKTLPSSLVIEDNPYQKFLDAFYSPHALDNVPNLESMPDEGAYNPMPGLDQATDGKSADGKDADDQTPEIRFPEEKPTENADDQTPEAKFTEEEPTENADDQTPEAKSTEEKPTEDAESLLTLMKNLCASAVRAYPYICASNSNTATPWLRSVGFRVGANDESAQSGELDGLLPKVHNVDTSELWIDIGDHKQLPPTVISSKAFYRGKLTDGPGTALDKRQFARQVLRFMHGEYGVTSTVPFLCLSVPDGVCVRSSTRSRSNPHNIAVILDLIDRTIARTNLKLEDIVIVTPYRDQVAELKRALRSVELPDIRVVTADSFQGGQARMIIFDSVVARLRGGGLGFITDPRRLNVSLSRALDFFVMVCDHRSFENVDQYEVGDEDADIETGNIVGASLSWRKSFQQSVEYYRDKGVLVALPDTSPGPFARYVNMSRADEYIKTLNPSTKPANADQAKASKEAKPNKSVMLAPTNPYEDPQQAENSGETWNVDHEQQSQTDNDQGEWGETGQGGSGETGQGGSGETGQGVWSGNALGGWSGSGSGKGRWDGKPLTGWNEEELGGNAQGGSGESGQGGWSGSRSGQGGWSGNALGGWNGDERIAWGGNVQQQSMDDHDSHGSGGGKGDGNIDDNNGGDDNQQQLNTGCRGGRGDHC